MSWLIMFDADNTLWDADAVYRNAQLQLLSVLAGTSSLHDPQQELRTLREIDMDLARHLGVFEYDAEQLARALVLRTHTGLTGDALIDAVTSKPECALLELGENRRVIRAAAQAFYDGLLRVPELFPDTVPVLRRIHSARSEGVPLVTAVLTEGQRDRIERIFASHHVRIRELFDEIIIVKSKSKQAFEDARMAMSGALRPDAQDETVKLIMIGDTLTRDIKFGNQAGYLTVYKPSPFKGREQPSVPDEVPDFTIDRLSELPPILESIGIPLGNSDVTDQVHAGRS